MKELIISIRSEKIIGFTLYVNDKHYHKTVSFQDRIKCWELALGNLDSDVSKLSDSTKCLKNNNFFWSYTYENHRNDGVLGTIHHYYAIELFNLLEKEYKIKEIKIEQFFPYSFYKFLILRFGNKIKIPLKGRVEQFLKFYLYYYVKPIYKISNLLFSLNVFRPLTNSTKKIETFVCSSRKDRISNRFDFIKNQISNENVAFYAKKLNRNLKSQSFASVNFFSLVFSVSLIKIVKKSVNLRKSVSEYLEYTSLFELNVKLQSFWQYLYLILKESLFEKALIKIQPKEIYYSGSIADPEQKLSVATANRLKIKSIVVACRPTLSSFRSEDRIIKAELIDDFELPDLLIVKDNFSKKTLTNFGYSEEKISVVHYSIDNEQKLTKYYENCLVLLLTQYDINTLILEELSSTNYQCFDKLLIRSHPNRRSIHAIDAKQERLIKDIKLPTENITDFEWNNLRFTNCVALGVNSTAMLEASSRGCGLIWLPYLSDLALQYFPVMDRLGAYAQSTLDFKLLMDKLIDSEFKTELVEKTNNYYLNEFH